MPTYEYECTACGQHIEVFQRISEDPLSTCGVCGGPLRKVFHPVGIVFKGSGFYATDSRAGAGAAAKKDSDGSRPADVSSSGRSKDSPSSDSSSTASSDGGKTRSTPKEGTGS